MAFFAGSAASKDAHEIRDALDHRADVVLRQCRGDGTGVVPPRPSCARPGPHWVIWFHDIRNSLNRSRRTSAFHTPAALREILDRDRAAELKALGALPSQSASAPYQHEATRQSKGSSGTARGRCSSRWPRPGKTLTLVNEVYRLMKSGAARRVLFLVDRRALAAQAVRTFASFEAEPGQKFDKIYELYCQRFFRDDLGDDRAFDPKVMPTGYLTNPPRSAGRPSTSRRSRG